jgi:hypothetical protein
VTLLNGFSSYLGDVATAAALEAAWQVGQHRIKAYVYYHHPVLPAGHGRRHGRALSETTTLPRATGNG